MPIVVSNMKEFFSKDILLDNQIAIDLYNQVKDLPIIDYHCHLDQDKIAHNDSFDDIGSLWLMGDHYKWRAMRLCDVNEYYINLNIRVFLHTFLLFIICPIMEIIFGIYHIFS